MTMSSDSINDYSKALADALMEQQQEEQTTKPLSKQQRARKAYTALCYDDPRVDSDASLHALGEALLKKRETTAKTGSRSDDVDDGVLALSERMVDGLLQATNRIDGATSTATHKTHETADESDGTRTSDSNTATPSSLILSEASVASAAGYATLATIVFVHIPLQCCHADHHGSSRASDDQLYRIQRYLGSYLGPRGIEEAEEESELRPGEMQQRTEQQQHDSQKIQALSESLHQMNDSGTVPQTDESEPHKEDDDTEAANSLEEVWAAESDPSDYEYESENPLMMMTLQELDDWPSEEAFDPILLSKPNPANTWSQARRSIRNLLGELTYSKFGCLSESEWKALNLSDLLTQLTLLLLVQPSLLGLSEQHNDKEQLLSLRQLGMKPLFVLRDRAASRHDVWSEYLTLLQSLIAVHAAATSITGSSSEDMVIAPATRVGLSSLSALCQGGTNSSNRLDPRRLRRCVLETCEDLANLLEETQHQQDAEATTRVVLALLPLLDRLTNIKPDGTVLASGGSLEVSNDDAQLLLSSGLFRSLILSFARNEKVPSSTTMFARRNLLQCLYVLSLQSPAILGKYAWRVPELSQHLHVPSFAEEHVVDGLLWNLLGTTLSSGRTVRLNLSKKSTGTLDVPVQTPDLCRQVCLDSFQLTCKLVIAALGEIRKIRTNATSDSSQEQLEQHSKELISDFARLANYLVSCPKLASLWDDVIASNSDAKAVVESGLSTIRSALLELPHVPTAGPSKTEKSADNDKAGDPISRPNAQFEEEEGVVRKAVKILALSIRSVGGAGATNVMLSSKTD